MRALEFKMRHKLRQILAVGNFTIAPGVGDPLTAMMVENAGFSCVSLSGYQAAALMGYPDIGLVTMTEMVTQAARICSSVRIPVIVDGDNGHGNAINTIRTIQEFERAGAAAIHLEDQSLPKKCGHMTGQVLVSVAEMCGKIQAATDARRSSDFIIIARSDAIPVSGLDDAIQRGRQYRSAGADAIMVMGPRSVEDLKRYRDKVQGPLVLTMGSWNFSLNAEEIRTLGYQLVMYPLSTLRRSVRVVAECLRELHTTGFVDHSPQQMATMTEMSELLGLPGILAAEMKYASTTQAGLDDSGAI